MFTSATILRFSLITACATGIKLYKDVSSRMKKEVRYGLDENDSEFWRSQDLARLRSKLEMPPIEGLAKNLILFLGDGMSLTTVTASRIYFGQLQNRSGEESLLSFEQFPYTGLSKTYCVDRQVPDSSCTATAYLCGVKANIGTLGVTASVEMGNCNKSSDRSYQVDSILDWAQAGGKATGLVTTARITDASPAGHYAHIANRSWESDFDLQKSNREVDKRTCQDIASQLVYNDPGKNCKVIMGGGRSKFIPANPLNPAWGEGERRDSKSLIEDWKKDKKDRGNAKFVTNREELLQVDTKNVDYLLGLFQRDRMLYHLEEGSEKQPSLAEMTEVAIKLLRKENKGFYLFVEGGNIDTAHHNNYARRALDETVEFNKAIQVAIDLVDVKDTLIVVTADHSHTMTLAGYPRRGEDILGTELKSGTDNLEYPTISYANGPSAKGKRFCTRRDVTNYNTRDVGYKYPSLVRLGEETHGGEDVPVYARGPWAHLLVGTYEQTFIPQVMAYAARIGMMSTEL